MREDDFNLIHEPWICVHKLDGSIQEMSLLELFQKAHTVQSLAGDLPTQDAAILRLLLAILHTVFSRVDGDGREEPLEELEKKESMERWQDLWERGEFPMAPIGAYLQSVEDRFWLFDEEHPFYQLPAAKRIAGLNGKNELKCKAVKLNASINQSDNKTRIFVNRAGEELQHLSYAEAARWLVHMVACDDSAVKKSDECKQREKNGGKTDSPGVGWLGKLGTVYAEGDNLFETLMLNLVFWPNGQFAQPQPEMPAWEMERLPGGEREKVPWPDNMASLLTWPSRYALLERQNRSVIGCYPMFGPFFDPNEPTAALEQMTCRNGKGESPYAPKLHRRGTYLWQECGSLLSVGAEGDDSRPGVVRWIGKLQSGRKGIDRNKLIRFTSVGIYYDKNRCSIEQIQSDTLSLHADLLSELAQDWRAMIAEEVAYTDKIAWRVGQLARNLEIAACGATLKKGKIENTDQLISAANKASAAFYDTMDLPFREWLCSISAQDQDREEKRSQWRALVRKKAGELGAALAHRAGPAAYRGHIITEEGKAAVTYATPALYGRFCARLKN